MSRPWMPLYVADYLADTSHLSCEEHGAYLLLIMHYWQKGGLPDDDRKLASIARAMPEQWLSMRDTIAEFFGEGWTHARIDEELAEAEEKYQKRANAGRKGGKAKAMPEQSLSNAKAGLNQPQPQPPITNASALDAAKPRDVRDMVWTEGVSILSSITGKTTPQAKSLVGKWLKTTHDDCALVFSKIKTAQAERIGDPVPWITAAVMATAPPKERTVSDVLGEIAAGTWKPPGTTNEPAHPFIETSFTRGN